MGVVVGIESQNPRPFGSAQGGLCVCKERRRKDGAPSGVRRRKAWASPHPRELKWVKGRASPLIDLPTRLRIQQTGDWS